MMKDVLKKRMTSTTTSSPPAERSQGRGDLLDHIIQDMSTTEKFITEDFIVQLMFGLLFVTSDSVSTTLALAFKLLEEHPAVLEELTVSTIISLIVTK